MKFLVLAVGVACVLGCTSGQSGTVFRAVPWEAAVIPQYNVDSVTRDSASTRLYALVGTVADSASGRPLGSVQILLRQPDSTRARYAWTDSLGGFVLGRVLPGRYSLTIRRIGYTALNGARDARAGVVDTLRARIAVYSMGLQTPTAKETTGVEKR